MTPNIDIESLLRALDPLTEDLDHQNATHRDAVWDAVVTQENVTPRRAHRWKLVGASSFVTVGAVVALIVGLLPGTSPLSAAATTLRHAAAADASAAALPPLASGEYYYQAAQVTMTCEFAAPTPTGSDPWIGYVSEGTMQSWTDSSGNGRIVITPTPVNQGGSHFATAADEATWVAEGRPFVPCALLDPSNQLIGNSANTDTQGSLGGYSTSVSGYSGLGVILGFVKSATTLTTNGVPVSLSLATSQSTGNVTSLPADVQEVSAMLANGEINPTVQCRRRPRPVPWTPPPTPPRVATRTSSWRSFSSCFNCQMHRRSWVPFSTTSWLKCLGRR